MSMHLQVTHVTQLLQLIKSGVNFLIVLNHNEVLDQR